MNDLVTIETLQRAIALVAAGQLDYKKIVVQLAQHHPAIFVQLATNTISQQWHRTVKAYILEDGNRVAGIKLLRERTGIGLKEALDVCHAAKNLMYKTGECREYHEFPDNFTLEDELQTVARTIANA